MTILAGIAAASTLDLQLQSLPSAKDRGFALLQQLCYTSAACSPHLTLRGVAEARIDIASPEAALNRNHAEDSGAGRLRRGAGAPGAARTTRNCFTLHRRKRRANGEHLER